MRQIFRDAAREQRFRDDGYVVVDLLGEGAIGELWAFYAEAFRQPRQVVPYARALPYYISIFDGDRAHKREVDERISRAVGAAIDDWLIDYRVFSSNFMIKFPGDGQIEAHQDFNFVDESRHTAFNLWCPLVDTDARNGGLEVIAGSHRVFRTQRGPNLPKALTEYNDTLRKYARRVPIRRGQAIVFDHRLIHGSPPNTTATARVAVQSVLTPREATTIHYVYDPPSRRVKAYRIDKDFILDHDLWDGRPGTLPLDHEQDLVPFPTEHEVTTSLAALTVAHAARRGTEEARPVFQDADVQRQFDRQGFAVLPVLGREEIERLTALFVETTGGTVENSAYGMYIGLEDEDLERKRAVIRQIADLVLPRLAPRFAACKPHLGSFLVKAPGAASYTYPHQDWTFVDGPRFRSITVWIALVDVGEANGALGFVPGSHLFFDRPVGSPSPEFETCTQGHEALLYEYLQSVPLRAGEAVAFDNRTIHGATPNLGPAPRLAVAIGMTPAEARLHHYFLVPGSRRGRRRQVAKLAVDPAFFERYSVASLKALFDAGQLPEGCETVSILEEDFVPFTAAEMRQICEAAGLVPNGRQLQPPQAPPGPPRPAHATERFGSAMGRLRRAIGLGA